jgi:DNA ligase-1
MVAGAIAPVASAVVGASGDEQVLDQFKLQIGRPLRPMLASPAPDMSTALDKIDGLAALEWKLDGIRVQAHRDGEQVRIFTRTLDDVTDRLPEIVEAVRSLPSTSVVLDGEVIALDDTERPRPFQVTASRVGSRTDVARLRATVPLRAFFFDLLHHEGRDLLGDAGRERWAVLETVLPPALRVPRLVTSELSEASAFFADACRRGHEGVVVKSLTTPYEAGRRGSAWIKVKPRHTLDLVVLAVEWGHGRRTGLLSNLHLGARDPRTDEFVMLGKTFKGLTDELLRWQTERFLELAVEKGDWVVRVRPEQVVEIAFDGVQTSRRYPGGMALRFARVVRYRDDKTAAEADTIGAVRAIHAGRPTG